MEPQSEEFKNTDKSIWYLLYNTFMSNIIIIHSWKKKVI